MSNYQSWTDGDTLLNDAYAYVVTELAPDNPDGWVPSKEIDEDTADRAIESACWDNGGGDYTRNLIEILLASPCLEGDPIWNDIEAAATRALLDFAEEMDEEAHYMGLDA